MEEPTETDEFEKYFMKSHASKLRAEDLLRRGSLPESGKKVTHLTLFNLIYSVVCKASFKFILSFTINVNLSFRPIIG